MDIYTPLLIGLVGSFHCVGMCGPIALALPVKQGNWLVQSTGILIYNFGRVLTYGLLGLVFGLIGQGIQLAGFQRWTSIVLGAAMVLSVLLPHLLKRRLTIETLFTGYASRLVASLKKRFSVRSNSSLATIGLLNGLLPCGLVYVAIAGAINTNHAATGVWFMVLFGLGTIPLLFVVSFAGNLISQTLRQMMRKLVPYVVVLLGVLFILRGMALGIPYISPMPEKLVPQEQTSKGSCCH